MLKSVGHESSLQGGAPLKCFGRSPFDDPGQHTSEINGESGGLEKRTPLFVFLRLLQTERSSRLTWGKHCSRVWNSASSSLRRSWSQRRRQRRSRYKELSNEQSFPWKENQYKMLTEAEFNMHLMFAMFFGAKQLFPTLVSISLNSLAPFCCFCTQKPLPISI